MLHPSSHVPLLVRQPWNASVEGVDANAADEDAFGVDVGETVWRPGAVGRLSPSPDATIASQITLPSLQRSANVLNCGTTPVIASNSGWVKRFTKPTWLLA